MNVYHSNETCNTPSWAGVYFLWKWPSISSNVIKLSRSLTTRCFCAVMHFFFVMTAIILWPFSATEARQLAGLRIQWHATHASGTRRVLAVRLVAHAPAQSRSTAADADLGQTCAPAAKNSLYVKRRSSSKLIVEGESSLRATRHSATWCCLRVGATHYSTLTNREGIVVWESVIYE